MNRPLTPKLLSLSLSESGVEADNDDRDGRDMATDRADLSRTLVIGPWLLIGTGDVVFDVSCEDRRRGLNAAICCETPSARMNCSRNSMFVRPLARHGSFFSRNSSRAHHPPPTRTMTVLRKILTKRNFCESPNRYFPSPTWKTRNFCRQVHNITKRLTSS